jgi:hypothetical protein
MPDGVAPTFTTIYARLYEILHKLHLNMYILKFPTNFVAHLTFHVLKLKLFLVMNKNKTGSKRCNQKWMPSSIGWWSKFKIYFVQSKHVLVVRNI